MKRTTVTLPDELAERIQTECRRRRIPVSQIVREALEEKLGAAEGGEKRFGFIGIVRGGGKYPQSDETHDFLKEHWPDAIAADRGG